MPRAVRDSDEDVEAKSTVRRTRASAAAVTDSPVRRSTRHKPLSVIDSSPESLDDSSSQRGGRTTRSRAPTLEKGTIAALKNLRSRKNSASSDVSESVEMESEGSQKRVTRKTAAAASVTGTPTKTSLRSRTVRAGSEAKSTPPPTRSKRVTRASSVDPVSNLNDSVGTPVKRRTRASMIPMQPTLTEEQEALNKASRSLENTVVEIDENDSEISIVSQKEKSNKKSKTEKDTDKDTSNVKESFDDSGKSTLHPSEKTEESMTDKSCISNETIEESTIKSFTMQPIDSTLESSINAIKSESSFLPKRKTESNLPNSFLLINDSENSKINPISKSNNKSNIKNDENEIIDVEELTESTLTDESVQDDSPQINKNEIISDHLKLDIKNAYVKLDRTSVVEKILMEKIDENKNDNLQECRLDRDNNISRHDVIENAKTAVVLVNDIIKNNENSIKLGSEKGVAMNSLGKKTENVKIDLITLNDDDDDEVMEISIIEDRGENQLENSDTFDKHCNEKENLTLNSTTDSSTTEISSTLETVIDKYSETSLLNKINDNSVKSSSISIKSDEIEDKDGIIFLDNKISGSEFVNKSNCVSENPNPINVDDNETESTEAMQISENPNPINVDDNETESTEAMQISENPNPINVDENETESTEAMQISENSNPINVDDNETESTEAMQISENSNLINANNSHTENTEVMQISENSNLSNVNDSETESTSTIQLPENSNLSNVNDSETESTATIQLPENSNLSNVNDSETESTATIQLPKNSNLTNANDNETENNISIVLLSDDESINSISKDKNEENSKCQNESDVNDSVIANASSHNEIINSISTTNNDKIVENSVSVDESSHDKHSILLDQVDNITQIESKNLISTSETDLLLESSITKNTYVNNDKLKKSISNSETSNSVIVDIVSKDANASTVNSTNGNSKYEIFTSKNVNESECYKIVSACNDNDKIKAQNPRNDNNPLESIKESNHKVKISVEQSTDSQHNLSTKEPCDPLNACNTNVTNFIPNEVDNHQSNDSLSLNQPNNEINKSEHVNEMSEKSDSVLIEEDIESADSCILNEVNKELIESNSVNNQINDVDSKSSVDECSKEMETNKSILSEPMECNLNSGNDEIETINIPDDTDSDSNEIEPQFSGMDKNSQSKSQLSETDKNNETESQMSGMDKNSVSSAVTDADGESASSPEKVQRSSDASRKSTSPKKSTRRESEQRRRSKADESDAEDAGDLFQDIPAEDWSHNKSQSKVAEKDGELNTTNENSSDLEASHGSSKKEMDIDSNEASIEEANSSVSKRTCKSSDRKRVSGQMAPNPKADTSESKDDAEDQESKETEESSNIDTEKDENSSPNKSRRSTRKSLEANQSSSEKDKNKSMSEKLSTSLNDSKSPNKNRKSFNTSLQSGKSSDQNNESVKEELSTSLNSSKTEKRQSLSNRSPKPSTEEFYEESMEVDEVSEYEDANTEVNDKSLNKSRKSLNKSQLNQSSSKDESTPEKLSTSLNTSKTSKRQSLEKSMNTSSRKSLSEKQNEEDVSFKKENRKSMNKMEEIENLNQSQSALNNSKKLKRLSLNESSRKSLIQNEDEGNASNDEMDVDSVNNKSLNQSNKVLNTSKSKSINDNEQTVSNADVSLKNKDKSLRESSLRKSISKVINVSNVIAEDSSETEVEGKENDKKNSNKSINNKYLLNVSTKSFKSAKNTPVKSPAKDIIKDSDVDDDNIEPPELNDSQLNKSLQKSVELMKFQNPPKLDYSTIAQANSSSDEEEDENEKKIPGFLFRLSDSDATEESDEEDGEEDEDDSRQKSIDSDIAREYNLDGKDISRYSDDDVPGDDCRASEEELSDSDDDGSDLQDFVVSNTGIEDDEDETENSKEDEEDEEEAENYEDDDEIKDDVKNKSDKKIKVLTEMSINNSKSKIKNKSMNITQYSSSSGSETDNEVTETEVENKTRKNKSANSSKLLKNKSINDSKTIKEKNINTSKLVKDKSINDSKSMKNRSVNISKQNTADSDSDSNNDTLQKKNKSANVSKVSVNKSINKSKSAKEVSMSKSIKDQSINDSKLVKNNITNLSKTRLVEASSSDENDHARSSMKTKKIPSIVIEAATSESENGEDSYRIITPKPLNTSITQPKNKKLTPLIECSTPKPGMAKKTDFSKAGESFIETDNLSVSMNKSITSMRKSASLADLTSMKNVSSRLSVGEATTKSILKNSKANNSMKFKEEVNVIGTCEEAMKSRQLWKCVPLNKTAHPSSNETPVTKFLKKSKLNDSLPVLKISEPTAEEQESVKNTSKSEKRKSLQNKSVDKIVEQQVEQASVDKKSKKRKLEDVSLAASIDEDSMIKAVTKNKKRARIEESVMDDLESEQYENHEEVQDSKKKKKKKNKHVEIEDNIEAVTELAVAEDTQKIKKKKKNKSKEPEVEQEVPETVEETQKKKKKNKQVDVEQKLSESPVSASEEKQKKKKKKKLLDAENEIEDQNHVHVEVEKPKKKKNRLSDEISDLENVNVNVVKPAKKSKHSLDSNASEKKSKKKAKEELLPSADADDDAPDSIGFEEARRSALIAMQQAADSVAALKDVHKKKQQEKADRKLKEKQEKTNPVTGIKRLPEDIIDNLTEDVIKQPEKRRKLANKQIDRVMPSKSMFSPGKIVPVNLKVDDGYVPLSSAGGTTDFAVMNLIKAKKAVNKKNVAALTFREKMLSRNFRQPISAYLSYQKKLKAKTGL